MGVVAVSLVGDARGAQSVRGVVVTVRNNSEIVSGEGGGRTADLDAPAPSPVAVTVVPVSFSVPPEVRDNGDDIRAAGLNGAAVQRDRSAVLGENAVGEIAARSRDGQIVAVICEFAPVA